ncbi:catechol 2,3-dioxygenase [Duganella sp. CF402]|uniref:VOC family protein n=1 Tax=unclassified Duganella TaxID=2636909 RepID=UPI0008D77FDD|nr:MULTISPECIES: VOC family protein [unclassified Duganella]RZT09292.1 catechol 2,3-dioxygenase [Duganella sp. BK701]SEL62960.1 catechol 2,3-dioxygenase [Duganella sp. CF402]
MPASLAGKLRSIAIGVTDLAAAEEFYVSTWRLSVAARSADAVYLRGSGADHHILALHRSAQPDVRRVDFVVAAHANLALIAAGVRAHGGHVLNDVHDNAEPDGGSALDVQDPQGRHLRFVHAPAAHVESGGADAPVRITHVVFNSADVPLAQAFYEQALGFSLSDRTRIMAFMRCGSDHHSIALADADSNTLNHIAFVMPDLDAVMRGAGRMSDAGYPIEWGVGRHGPGNNVFSYFVGPDDFVIEYTAEVLQVDDSYRVGKPEDWTWPPGRFDQWGVSKPPSDRIKQAQKKIRFTNQ